MPLLSEDCLTINVFRPSNLLPDAKLPVVRPSMNKRISPSVTNRNRNARPINFFGRG